MSVMPTFADTQEPRVRATLLRGEQRGTSRIAVTRGAQLLPLLCLAST